MENAPTGGVGRSLRHSRSVAAVAAVPHHKSGWSVQSGREDQQSKSRKSDPGQFRCNLHVYRMPINDPAMSPAFRQVLRDFHDNAATACDDHDDQPM